jgi:hypothetical protein
MENVGIYMLGHLEYFVAIWYILWTFGILCGHLVYLMDIWYIVPTYERLVYFEVICYISPHFGMSYQEISGNPSRLCAFFPLASKKIFRERNHFRTIKC